MQAGPVAAGQLLEMAKSGQLLRADLVWKDGMANWVEAGTARGLFPEPAAATPPPTPSFSAQDSEPPEFVSQASASQTSDAFWYYEERGTRIGPVTTEQMTALLQSGSLTLTSKVWKKGLADWTKLSDTELSPKLSASEEPPALSATQISNVYAWLLAALPLPLFAIAALYSAATGNELYGAGVGLVVVVLTISLLICDSDVLKKAGHETPAAWIWIGCLILANVAVPVYLYQRTKALKQRLTYFVVAAICWTLPIIGFVMSALA